MLLQTINDTTQTSANFATNSMGVKADGRMFRLILKNLYNNPHDSIVRELSTNALDAHNLVGNKNPFFIQLPTKWGAKEFIIRDFGPGLDEVEINKYLNVLFSSNKDQDNNLAGGYGLTQI